MLYLKGLCVLGSTAHTIMLLMIRGNPFNMSPKSISIPSPPTTTSIPHFQHSSNEQREQRAHQEDRFPAITSFCVPTK